MARKPRLEFDGAIYHILNRRNYRADVFGRPGAAEAFQNALFEAAEKCHWVIPACVVMSNHCFAPDGKGRFTAAGRGFVLFPQEVDHGYDATG